MGTEQEQKQDEEARLLEVPDQLIVGIVLATDPVTTRALLSQFCFALSEATKIDVEPRGFLAYQELLEELEQGAVDIVWLPPILALRAVSSGQVAPVAMPVRNGVSSYSTALFARPDSPIRTLADLNERTAAWVDPQSGAGYLILRAHLQSQGVSLRTAFTRETFLGTHNAVVEAVMSGEADVGATYLYLDPDAPDDEPVPKSAGWGDRDVTIVTHAGPIPMDLVAADRRVNPMVVRLLQSALTDTRNAELRHAGRALLGAEAFVAAGHEHLDPLAALLEGLGDASDKPHSILPPPA